MEFISKLKAFLNLGEIKKFVQELTEEKYKTEQFQDKLLNINKIVRTAYFKYDEPTFNLDEMYTNLEKKLKVSIAFTQGKGSVQYTFKDFDNNELATIFTNGREHEITMNNVKIQDSEQINTLFKMLGLETAFHNIKEICYHEYNKQKIMKETAVVQDIIKKQLPDNINEHIINNDYVHNTTIYFDIINLSLKKMLKEKKLTLENNHFLNFNVKDIKNTILQREDINLTINEFKDANITLKIKSMNVLPYYNDSPKDFLGPKIDFEFSDKNSKLLGISTQFAYIDFHKDKNIVKSPIEFHILKKPIGRNFAKLEIENNQNKVKLLNFVKAFPLLEETKFLLIEENKKLDEHIAIKTEQLNYSKKESKEIISNKIEELKNKLAPMKIK